MSWLGPAAWAPREARAGDRLPYARMADDNTIALRDGSLMRVLGIAGLPFETEDSEQLDHMLAVRDTMLRSVLDARFIVYHHVIRRRVAVGMTGAFPDPFSATLDARWQDRLGHTPLFVNDQFITVVRRPARGKAGWFERLGRKVAAAPADDLRVLRELESAVSALQASLAPYGGRLLGTLERGRVRRCEPLELLSAIYNGEWRAVAADHGAADLGHYLPYARVSFGLEAIETRSGGRRDFAALVSLKDYPITSFPPFHFSPSGWRIDGSRKEEARVG